MPDTAIGGYTSFNRYFFAQMGREGAVVDERYNHGGDIADYVIEYLNRKPMGQDATREGDDDYGSDTGHLWSEGNDH